MTPKTPSASNPDRNVADRNVEKLLSEAYSPAGPDPDFVRRGRSNMLAEAARRARARQRFARPR